MSELRPLLAEHDDEFELALLRSADRDEPSDRGKLRVAAALGLGVSAAATSLAAASGAGVSGVSGVSSAGAKLGLPLVLKSLAIGTAAGLATLGTLNYADVLPGRSQGPVPVVTARAPRTDGTPLARPSEPPRVESAPELAPPPAIEPAVDPGTPRKPAAPLAASAPADEPPAEALPASEAPAPAPEPVAPEAPRAASIAGEIAEIDRIRGALRQGQAARALSALDRYFASSPTRVLETEASILRIDALVALGQRQRARTLARELVARQPMSRHADRLRQLAEE